MMLPLFPYEDRERAIEVVKRLQSAVDEYWRTSFTTILVSASKALAETFGFPSTIRRLTGML